MDSIRKSGIDVVGEVPWGTHLSPFYTDEERPAGPPRPYFKAGLESNEFCMWVTSEPLAVEEAEGGFEARGARPGQEARVRPEMIVPYTDGTNA